MLQCLMTTLLERTVVYFHCFPSLECAECDMLMVLICAPNKLVIKKHITYNSVWYCTLILIEQGAFRKLTYGGKAHT